MANVEEELHSYLKERKIEEMLKALVVKLCVDKPDDHLEYMKQYFAKLQRAGDKKEEEEEEEEEEEVGGHASLGHRGSRRGAISASVIDADDVQNYERKVVPKDAATMLALQKSVSENILFQHLEVEELNEVLDAMFLLKVSPGTEVIKQGDDGDNFYVISSGTVEVWKADKDEAPKHLLDLNAGASFGELALMYNQPRAATVKAKTDCALWAIDADTYRRIIMGATIKKRKTYEAFLEKVPILASVNKYERLQMADALQSRTYSDKHVICKQGDMGDEFFILVEGEVVFTQTNDKGETGEVGRTAQPGSYFGEIALLKDNKRHATVTCNGVVKVVYVDRDTFERVLGPCEDILRRNMENYQKFA